MALKDDLTQLNNIMDLLEDSRQGYHEAAERAEDPNIKALLDELGASRTTLIMEVEALRRKADPEGGWRNAGTIKGDLHRAWMDLRDALSSTENVNVLEECERGEAFLLMRYDEVQQKDVAPETFALVQAQRGVVHANVDRIKQLRRQREKVE